MKIEEVLVTPVVAQKLLSKNTENWRKPEQKRVNLYAKEMSSGNWHRNGDTIKMSDAGMLLDGQHRLLAVVKSGCNVPMIIVSGIECGASTIDRGKPRTLAAWLTHEGHKNSNSLAACARLCITYSQGRWAQSSQGGYITDSEVIRFIDEHLDRLHSAIKITHGTRGLLPQSICSAIAFHGTDGLAEESQTAVWFFSRLADGQQLTNSDAVYHLRSRMLDSKGKVCVPLIARAYATMAWNKTVRGETCNAAQLRITFTGPNTTKLPEVIEKAGKD